MLATLHGMIEASVRLPVLLTLLPVMLGADLANVCLLPGEGRAFLGLKGAGKGITWQASPWLRLVNARSLWPAAWSCVDVFD